MAGYLDASGLEHFKRKNDAAYLGKREKAASAAVADSVDWKNVSGRPDLSAVIPPGTLIHYAGRTVPSSWLICNGANVSRKDYAALFAAIGTIYGTGDGSTTFGPPNLNGRFLECTTSASSVAYFHTAGLPNITGTWVARCLTDLWAEGRATGALYRTDDTYKTATSYKTDVTGGLGLNATLSAGVYGASYSVQPPAMDALVLIKT